MDKYNTYEIWENKKTGEIKHKKIDEKSPGKDWIRRIDLEKEEGDINPPPNHTK